MKDDPVIERIRGVRRDQSAEFGHDPEKLVTYYLQNQNEICRKAGATLAEAETSKKTTKK